MSRSADRASPGGTRVPLAIVMISLNESHQMEDVCANIATWAKEVFLVDSYSADDTVDIALKHQVYVVQRRFRGFGDQWNFAMETLPITADWTMKLDPDERLTDALKREIEQVLETGRDDGYEISRRLMFMRRGLPVRLRQVRLWRTGTARFSDVSVNEYPMVDGRIGTLGSEIEHHDSPDLHHWLDKQNRYSTAEAIAAAARAPLADKARFFGTSVQRRMWIKQYFYRIPFRYTLLFLYHYLWLGTWRAGWVGYAWSHLRCEVYRMGEYKRREIALTGQLPGTHPAGPGQPDPRVPQY